MMTQSDSAFLNWEIRDFANLPPFRQSSEKFACKHNTFWMTFFAKDNLPSLKNHFAIYLYREVPLETDLKVLWTISLINDQGEECYRKGIETIYAADSGCYPIEGGLYHLDRYTILEPCGKLTVKFNVTILDGKNIDDDKQIRLSQKKKKSIQNSESLLDTFSDVVFVVDKKEFKLHKNILTSKSTVFSAMFENDLEEANQNRVEITDVDVKVFEAMIRFIYTGNVLDSGINQDLLFAAEKYQLDSLKDICADVLGLNLTIELQNASSSSSSSSSKSKRKRQTDASELKNTKKITKTRKSSGQKVKKMFACKFADCDRSFPSDWKLAHHERIHLGIKPFSCTWLGCRYSSGNKGDVVKHVRMKHFKLLKIQKEQARLNILDNRDPEDYVQVDNQLLERRLE